MGRLTRALPDLEAARDRWWNGVQKKDAAFGCILCDPGGARTLDPLIKSQLLYQLSYGVVSALEFCGANLRFFFEVTKFFGAFFDFW